MKITNSMTGKKEEFIPINKDEVKMYACGVTVYDLSHIGHARQAIVYAMMTDYFRYKGYKVLLKGFGINHLKLVWLCLNCIK